MALHPQAQMLIEQMAADRAEPAIGFPALIYPVIDLRMDTVYYGDALRKALG